MNKKLYKSRNKSVCGVCAGFAEYFDVDVTLVRLATFLLIFFGGVSIWAYIIAAIVMPEEPEEYYSSDIRANNTDY
ncbi:MAG: PspC domain-containing protein [Lachnospiraceae bacterium]|nr:PspC domain-containing protein [Lachnospiraceae bacterium]